MTRLNKSRSRSLEGASGADRHIVVTAAKRQWLDRHRQWRRPPAAAESDGAVAGFVREEVRYREALALGLDRDDLVVRRRPEDGDARAPRRARDQRA